MKIKNTLKTYAIVLFTFVFCIYYTPIIAQESTKNPAVQGDQDIRIVDAKKLNNSTIDISLSNQHKMLVDFYGDHIFRLFQDNSGKELRAPEAEPEAQILVDNPRKDLGQVSLSLGEEEVIITTDKIKLSINKSTLLFNINNLETQALIVESLEPIKFEKDQVSIRLRENPNEYFYGGGIQNGRFSHKGKKISIENQNSWTDGGVASPTPFYWSSKGYGIMWYTFKKGEYDFGAKEKGKVSLSHKTDYLDVFFMVNDGVSNLLNDFYQLTGNPVLLPKFGFYQGHLNAYNRDYWKEDEKGILFEDGKRYKESQKDNGGIKESLNGKNDNYQFSARAVIDRYNEHDMPLGWILPNDGYGAGYGQTATLDGNIQNLKELGDYARNHGVEIGLWTQSDLHPKEGISALLQRDIIKEVRDAGVRVLKTDVAWVGAGYSFGLNGVADVGQIMPKYGNNARPFIISLDGWAGTQRYAGIWSGDQTGGVWEYIRFHIPTYIGSGLSGQPNISSDMDGIFGGKNPFVNTRDFQWKTFTPMELNMDGWGANEKYPQALGEPTTSINRSYLKWKSELMPYTYSIAKEAVDGLPMVRAMFLEEKNSYTQGKATQYQFMYGPSFLVAPIYKETKIDEEGNDIRNGIYLPKGLWIDYFSGEQYNGNQIINSFDSPIWKLPVFVKRGAIIPLTNPNNNVSEINKEHRIYELYPFEHSSFREYDDDGITEAYKNGEGAYTLIESEVDGKNNLQITVHPSNGDYEGFIKTKSTEFRINITEAPKKVFARISGKKVKLNSVNTLEEFNNKTNVYFYHENPNLNRFSTPGTELANLPIIKNPQLLVKIKKTDITANDIELQLKGFNFNPKDNQKVTEGPLSAPENAKVNEENTEAYSLMPSWDKVANSDYYEIDFEGMRYTTIRDTAYLIEGLSAETDYTFQLRAVNKNGVSEWVEFKATTKSNPLEFAIQDIAGETSADNQGGYEIAKLFDFDEGNTWHTKWGEDAIPFDMIIDLKSFNQLDKLEYLPRRTGTNGILLKGKIYFSNDKANWTIAGDIAWEKDNETKVFNFDKQPTARYIKIEITEGVGGFGSGREMYVFKVPGTESYLPGDINNDGLIDENDLTSYINYTGLKRGDSDFEGYVSIGDVNKNDLIDAYDISVVATQLEGGVDQSKPFQLSGKLELSTDKTNYKENEIVEISIKGVELSAVNALSFALAYNSEDYEFIGIKPIGMRSMENMTNNRLHTNGEQVLYPTFVNLGTKETLDGNTDLFILRFKTKRPLKFNLKADKGLLVDPSLNTILF
ncbi:TIM-barrel domain-containing protein [Echinicola shivajiensis]|uniref:TIM-barrel domain-containing protein n=1 Tax=Echinicola shivajiensis TaxID=1035916 RepID=UPI001BFC8707|nr:TIM-barrel domain-containing protein [Echinicola shivajiensis]